MSFVFKLNLKDVSVRANVRELCVDCRQRLPGRAADDSTRNPDGRSLAPGENLRQQVVVSRHFGIADIAEGA